MHTNYWLRTALREGEYGDGGDAGSLLDEAGSGQEEASFTPSFDGVLRRDGAFTEGWTAKAFGPEYNGPLAGVKSLNDAEKLLRDNIAAARGRGLEWPGEKATPEQIAAVRKLTGAPEKPDGYGDLRPQTIPAELWDREGEAKLQATAHRHHLPPSAIKDIVGLYAETLDTAVKANEAAMQAHRIAEVEKLRQEFGSDYENKLFAAKRFALTLGLREDDSIFNNAATVIAMARGAALVSEDRLVNGQTQGFTASHKAQADAIMTDATNPHYKKYQEGDPNTVALVNNLLAQG